MGLASDLARRASAWLVAAVAYAARLTGPALAYIGRTLVDLFAYMRAAWLWFARRRQPERAPDIDAKLARSREKRSARWASWAAVPGGRRMEIRAAALVVTAILAWGLYTYGRLVGEAAEPVAWQAPDYARAQPQPRERHPPPARSEPIATVPTKVSPDESPRAAAERFQHDRDALKPGQWAVHRSPRGSIVPVLRAGEPGDWDDFGIASPVVMKEGGRYRMWYVGCRFFHAQYSCGIGHAESSDGIAWRKSRGPVLAIADPAESQWLHSITLTRLGEEYLMWYAVDSSATAPDDCSTVHLATSKDGLAWTPQGVALKGNCERTAHLWPGVFNDGKTLHLWFFDRDSGGRTAHLTSTDGRHWQPGEASFGKLSDQGRLAVIAEPRGGYRALFAGKEPPWRFEALRSTELATWEVATEKLAVSGSVFSQGRPEAPTAILDSGGLWMWFAFRDRGVEAPWIALAVEKEDAR